MAKLARRGFPSTAASRWTEPRQELAEVAQTREKKQPPDQYLGIDTATLYSLSLQSEAAEGGDQRASWAPFVYAYGLLVLVLGFLIIYFLIKAGGSAYGPQREGSGARKMTEEARTTESPPSLRTTTGQLATAPARGSSEGSGSSRSHSGHTTASSSHQGSDTDTAADALTTHSAQPEEDRA
ncbi:uncharacterized protein [Dermacentor albipictus]|uniref:uncharacterized protein isoform X1 n=1 Tax=Dermacentor albipictus TaxID=60249 RepID=UPI0031FCDE57